MHLHSTFAFNNINMLKKTYLNTFMSHTGTKEDDDLNHLEVDA